MVPERGRSTIDRGCELEAGSGGLYCLERAHRARLACRRPGAGAHRDTERGKVPSTARVACIARSACTSLTMSWWVGGSLRTCLFLFFGLGAAAAAACCCCPQQTSLLKRREVPPTVSFFSVSATTTAVSFASILLLLLLLRSCLLYTSPSPRDRG